MVHSHSIYVVGTNTTQGINWRQAILDKIVQHISDGYAVAYVGEEDEATVSRHFMDKGISIQEYIMKGLLTIINRDLFYSPFVPSKILLEQWTKLFASVQKKVGLGGFRGFIAMGMPADSFFLSEVDNKQLVQYESLAAKQYDGSLEAICLYTTGMIQRMPLRHIISLLNAHQNTGHRDGMLRQWDVKRGLGIINRGIDYALGPSMRELVMPILVRDFKMDEDAMVIQPDQFERKLGILLGASAAAVVINHIKDELCRDIAF